MRRDSWDFVDVVDLVNLCNSAEIYKKRKEKFRNRRRSLRLRPTGVQSAPVVDFPDSLCFFLYISAELNKLTQSTKSNLPSSQPPSQLLPFNACVLVLLNSVRRKRSRTTSYPTFTQQRCSRSGNGSRYVSLALLMPSPGSWGCTPPP